MEITVGENNTLNITKVFNGVKFITDKKETLFICMRDSGFEFTYNNVKYEAKDNIIKKVENKEIGEPFECGNTFKID
jgi:hypothetical protein